MFACDDPTTWLDVTMHLGSIGFVVAGLAAWWKWGKRG